MVTKNLYEPFEIELLLANDNPLSAHKHTFFEMVFILEGTGLQYLNNHQLPYSPDRMFLLFPKDCHSFEVHTPTKFFFLRFNDSYLKSQQKEWIQQLEFIFHNHNHLPGCILRNVTDKPLVRTLVEALLREQVAKDQGHHELSKQIINTLITIAARNIPLMHLVPVKQGVQNHTAEMMNYIHGNIHLPELLKSEKMAEAFNLSPSYISEYFKKQTGESLHHYITKYKLKLIETRLTYSNMRIGEIAYEFGFTDESHFSKTFKKYRGQNPSEYRNQSSVSTPTP